jgi:hypothetical protein
MAVANNGKLAQWLDDFINVLGKKDTITASNEKLAEVNINDLEKVVWNDETFHVMFDQVGATILNEFGNVVTTLPGVATIQDADSALNSKQVVTSLDPFTEELKKISTYLEADVNDPNNPIVVPDPNIPAPAPDASQTPPAVQPIIQPTQDPNVIPDPNTMPTTAKLNDDEEIDIDMDKDIQNMNNNLDILEKYADLESKYQVLAKKVEALTQQEYAHVDPGAVYDLNIRDAEEQHIQEMMNASQAQFDKEHNTDLTTPAGRISLIDKLSDDMNTIMDGEIGTESLEAEDPNLETEDPALETEDPTLNDETELELPSLGLELEAPENSGTSLPVGDSSYDSMNVDNHNNIDDIKNELGNEDVSIPKDEVIEEEIPKEIVEKEPIKKESSLDNKIAALNEKDSKLFKKQICPHCCESELVKENAAGNLVGIYCKACKSEYAVNVDTEEIFKKN